MIFFKHFYATNTTKKSFIYVWFVQEELFCEKKIILWIKKKIIVI